MRELARKKSVTHVFPLSVVEYNVYAFSIKDGFLLQYISNAAIISLGMKQGKGVLNDKM